MVAWANRESLERTLDRGRMVYWSRSRQELWRKGDTSGHVQHWTRAPRRLRRRRDRRHGAPGGCRLPHGRATCFFQALGDSGTGRAGRLRRRHVEAGHPQGLARGADVAAVRGRRPAACAGAPSRDYHGTIDDDRIERVSVLRPQEIPIYVAGRAVRPRDHRARTGSRRRGATSRSSTAPAYAQDRHGPRHADRARRAERAPGEHRRRDAAGTRASPRSSSS